MNNEPPIVKVNKNVMRLCNAVKELDNKVSQLTADVETIKSYIKQQQLKDKEKLEQVKEEIKTGWWFS
tara:strand:- start:4347 stop:4550 length:204 start_codon:yes stop_codon:yes gene_type:complete